MVASLEEAWPTYDSDAEPEDINEFYKLSNFTDPSVKAARYRNKHLVEGAHVSSSQYGGRMKRVPPSPSAAYAPVDYISKTTPLYYNDHSHVKRIFHHLSECRQCKLSFMDMFRQNPDPHSEGGPMPSLSSANTKEYFGGNILSRIMADTQFLIIIILLLIFYIIQSRK